VGDQSFHGKAARVQERRFGMNQAWRFQHLLKRKLGLVEKRSDGDGFDDVSAWGDQVSVCSSLVTRCLFSPLPLTTQ
jgi:hypothetical protein